MWPLSHISICLCKHLPRFILVCSQGQHARYYRMLERTLSMPLVFSRCIALRILRRLEMGWSLLTCVHSKPVPEASCFWFLFQQCVHLLNHRMRILALFKSKPSQNWIFQLSSPYLCYRMLNFQLVAMPQWYNVCLACTNLWVWSLPWKSSFLTSVFSCAFPQVPPQLWLGFHCSLGLLSRVACSHGEWLCHHEGRSCHQERGFCTVALHSDNSSPVFDSQVREHL